MDLSVPIQSADTGVGFRAELALKMLHTLVLAGVPLQCWICLESFVAMGAWEWTLPSVIHVMEHEIFLVGVSLPARFTNPFVLWIV